MTSKRFLAVAFAALTVLSGALAGVVVTGSAQAAPQDISSCTVIDQSGEYRLTNDITNETADVCLDIEADNVTIDGNGYTLDGVDKNGTGIETDLDSEITDVTVQQFDTAIVHFDGVVSDSTILDNLHGVEAGDGSDDAVVQDSYIARNDYVGVGAAFASITVQSTTIADNGDGVNVVYGNALVEDSTLVDNEWGMYGYHAGIDSTNNTVANNSEYGLDGVQGGIDSVGDRFVENGIGMNSEGFSLRLDGTVVSNNTENGVQLGDGTWLSSSADITNSEIRNNGGDGIKVTVTYDNSSVHDSVIADNGKLGVNFSVGSYYQDEEIPETVDATDNYWGSSDGPSSETSEPLEDPVTGELANGSGDAVSEGNDSGVSNVQFDSFLTENPLTTDDGEDSQDDSDDSQDGDSSNGEDDAQDDEEQNDDDSQGDDSDDSNEESGDDSGDSDDQNDDSQGEDDSQDDGESTPAYQIDLANDEVIETLGVDNDGDGYPDFYGYADGNLMQATTLLADGTVTGEHQVPDGETTESIEGCMVTYDATSYDAETGEVDVTVSVEDGADCDGVLVTLAGYELPGDETTFDYQTASEQELLDSTTVTLDAGEERTLTIDLTQDDDESSDN